MFNSIVNILDNEQECILTMLDDDKKIVGNSQIGGEQVCCLEIPYQFGEVGL